MGVNSLNVVLDVLHSIVVEVRVSSRPSEGSSQDGEKVSIDGAGGVVSPLVDLGLFEGVGSEEGVGTTLGGKESGNSSALEEDSVVGLKEGELAGENLGLGFLGFGFFLTEDDFSNMDLGEGSYDQGSVGEKVSSVVVVKFL
jgi:hypothetical protein